MNIEQTIEDYTRLREACYKAARANNAELMGQDYWLRNAMLESEISLEFTASGVRCYGHTYTNQTMGHEWFDFIIPLSELEIMA